MKQLASFLVITLFVASAARATHVRGGYIRALKTSGSSLTYSIEVIGFGDNESSVKFGTGQLDFGDNSVVDLAAASAPVEVIASEGAVDVLRYVVTHTYTAPGVYTISYSEFARNAGVLNMTNAVSTNFFTSTVIYVDPFYGQNTTPSFVLRPAIFSKTGTRFFNSIHLADAEDDSLVYSLAVPSAAKDEAVENYKWPNHESFYAGEERSDKPELKLDRLSGQLVWDTPQLAGEFALAYKVLEYRTIDGATYKMSETTVDIQIINVDINLAAPDIEFEYEIADNQRIDFRANYMAAGDADVEWSLYCSNDAVSIGEEIFLQHLITDTITSPASFNGFTAIGTSLERPVFFVLAARSIGGSNVFETIKSFAVNPKGGGYLVNGVDRPMTSYQLLTYPNPASNVLMIRFSEKYSPAVSQIELINAAGQSILKSEVPVRGNLATLNTQDLPGGIYVIRAYLGDQVYHSRFIKE